MIHTNNKRHQKEKVLTKTVANSRNDDDRPMVPLKFLCSGDWACCRRKL